MNSIKRRLIPLALFALGLMAGIALASSGPGVLIRRGSGEWIEIHYPDGTLSEWRPEDGEAWRVLDQVLTDTLPVPVRLRNLPGTPT